PRAVWFLLIGQFINRFGAFVFPFLTLVLAQRGLSGGQIALVLAAMSAGSFVGPIVGGYLSDAIGRRNTIMISLFGSASTVLLLSISHGPVQISLVAALH